MIHKIGKATQSKKSKTTAKRKQSVKPTAPPVQPPSVNYRFLCTPARDRFKDIRSFRVIEERGFFAPQTFRKPGI